MEDVIGYIQNMASDFYREKHATLDINDMSLIFGGLFDYKGTWHPPHSWHRDGTSADISRADSDGTWPGIYLKKKLPQSWENKYLPCYLKIESGNRLHIECSQRGLHLPPPTPPPLSPPGDGCGGKPCS
ncbi:MAG: hypothetical protein ACP5T7_06930 [bacterium]